MSSMIGSTIGSVVACEQDSVGPFLSLVRCSELQFQRLYLVIWLCCWFVPAQPPASILDSTVNGTGMWNSCISGASLWFLFASCCLLPFFFWRFLAWYFGRISVLWGVTFCMDFSVRCLFFARVSSLRLVCTPCFALGQFSSLSSVCMAALRCKSISRVLFLSSSWFYACGCLRGYTPRVSSWLYMLRVSSSFYMLRVSSRVYVAGILVCIRCQHLRACSAVSGSSVASPASCGLCTVSSRCRCPTGSRPGVSTCSEVVLSSSARSLLVSVVGFLLARAVF